MASSQVNGLSYTVDGSQITFFDSTGIKLSESKWAINAFGGTLLAEVNPDSMMEVVRDCIAGDVSDGNGDKIAQLQLGPRQAVIFFLEGKITREHLRKAVEGPNFVDIPNVEVDDRILTVRVLNDADIRVATADVEGNVL